MTESDGIVLESAENVEIFTEKKIDMECKKLSITSQDKIIFNTTGSNYSLQRFAGWKDDRSNA